MFCKHDWKILSEVTTESRLETLSKLGIKINEAPWSAMKKKFIQIVACSKCGKLKRFVEKL